MADITINEALGTVDLAGMDEAGRAAAQTAVKQASGLSRDRLIKEINRLRNQLPGIRGAIPPSSSPESANRIRIQVFAAALAKEFGTDFTALTESQRVDKVDSLAYDTDLATAADKIDHPPVPTTIPEQTINQLPSDVQEAVSGGADADLFKASPFVDPTAKGGYNRPATLSNSDIQYAFDPSGGNLDLAGLASMASAERVKQWRATHPGVSPDQMPTDLRAGSDPFGVRLYYDKKPGGEDTFGGPLAPDHFIGHGRVDKLDPFANTHAGIAATKSIRETLALLNTMPPEKIKAVQKHLVAGGFLDPNAVKQNRVAWGDPNDSFTRDAWRNLISASMQDRTRSMMQILQESETALAPHLSDILDPSGGGGTHVTISLTDPASIRVMSDQLSQNLIGRKLDPLEQAQLVQHIHDMERQQTRSGQVDPQARLTEEIRARHPAEAGAADVAGEFQLFNRLVKGTLPSEGGF